MKPISILTNTGILTQFLILLFLLSTFDGLSQSGINSHKIPLYDEIQKIAEKENLHLAYESGLLQNMYTKINMQNLNFNEALDLILSQTDLEYILTKDHQLLLRKKKLNNPKKLKLIGRIRDKQNRENIAFAAISLKGSAIGCYSDEAGNFNLVIPSDYIKGNDTIIIHRLGYNEKKIELNKFIHSGEVELDVKARLLPLVTILNPIEKLRLTTSLIDYDINNQDYAFSTFITDDVLRKIQYFPSIYANKDKSALINIRGSKSFETLILLDGLRVYHPTHFYNIFSSINNDYVEKINIYKNTIPPSIRSMTGGVVEMISKPVNKYFSADVDANLMFLASVINIPISNKAGLVLSARKSIFDKTQNNFVNQVLSPVDKQSALPVLTRLDRKIPEFKFYDFNGKFEYSINNNNKIQIDFFSSRDFFLDKYENILKKKTNDKTSLKISYRDDANWINTGIGIKYNLKFKNLHTNIALSSTNYLDNSLLDIKLVQKRRDSLRTNSILDHKKSSIQDLVFKINNQLKIEKNSSLDFGLDITNYSVVSQIKLKKNPILDISKKNISYSLYTSFWKKINKLEYRLSLKTSYFTGTTSYYFDPAINIKYRLTNKLFIYSSINKQHQFLREIEYETPQSTNSYFWDLADNSTPVLSSKTFSIGCTYDNHKSKINLEVYYKTQDGQSILLRPKPTKRDEPNPINLNYNIFYGDTYIYGLDIMWSQTLGNYTSQLAYTYSVFNQRFKQIFRNEYHPAPDDTRHHLKLIQNYKWNKWNFGLNLIYSSGTPYFDFSDLKRTRHRSEINFENYIKFLPDYFRSDASIAYSFKIYSKNAQLNFSIFNLTNRMNISDRRLISANRDFNPDNPLRLIQSQTNLLKRSVNIGVKIKL